MIRYPLFNVLSSRKTAIVLNSANTLSFNLASLFLVSLVSLLLFSIIANTIGVAYCDLKRERNIIASKIERSSSEPTIPYERY